MRISDWSSDVCSSDLPDAVGDCLHGALPALVGELKPTQTEDAVLVEFAFLVDAEGVGDDRAQLLAGGCAPVGQALVDQVFGRVQFRAEIQELANGDLDAQRAVVAGQGEVAILAATADAGLDRKSVV